eukprot:gene550-8062_t
MEKQNETFKKITIRPVLLKKENYFQFSFFTKTQDITKNFKPEESEEKIEKILSENFERIELKLSDQTQFISKNGKVKIKPGENKTNLNHDAVKNHYLKENERIFGYFGFTKEKGKISDNKYAKFRQINEFIKKIDETGILNHQKKNFNFVDCGCGISYLSLAFYYYLNKIGFENVKSIGIDVNEDVIAKAEKLADKLKFNSKFLTSKIQDVPEEFIQKEFSKTEDGTGSDNVDILFALHACNTATDESIAKGIRLNSKVIICAPCCHHEIKLNDKNESILQYGILKNRFEDILTDTFRALILKIFGYKTEVFEFISPEHTSKNIMIRAVKTQQMGNKKYLKEYKELKERWNISQTKLEEILQFEIKELSRDDL